MKLKKYHVAFIIITIFFISFRFQLFSQTNEKLLQYKVDSLFSQFNSPYSPGCAIGIMQDGKIVYKKGYGMADLEYDIPITPETIFHMASVSKQFTAFAIVLLAQQGKISLDDDIRKYLPEVPNFGKKITIKNLVYHTSGLRDQWDLLLISGWRLDDVLTMQHIMKLVTNQKELNFDPGSEFMYCNTGYTLLAEIVNKVSGKSFDEFTRKNIYDPLGMMNTHFHMDHEEIVKNRAYSYNVVETNKFKNSILSYANGGATSLFTNIDDMAKWINNFSDPVVGGKQAIEQILEIGTLNNGIKTGYAFGLIINDYKGLKKISHDGGDAGFRTNISIYPDQKFAVVVFSNLGNANPGMLANQITDIYLADKIKQDSKKERKEITLNKKILDQYIGTYQLFPGFNIIMTREVNRLMGQVTGQLKYQIFPESETEFFYKVVDAQITFDEPVNGVCRGFILHQNGQNMPAKRIEVVKLKVIALKEFEGDFYSDELGTIVTLVVKNSSLVSIDRRNSDIFLTFIGDDTFTMGMQSIKFQRNNKNRITGFLSTTGRVRNLKFIKNLINN